MIAAAALTVAESLRACLISMAASAAASAGACRIDPALLAAECQKKFACSTSVNDLPGKNNPGQEVILQVGGVCIATTIPSYNI